MKIMSYVLVAALSVAPGIAVAGDSFDNAGVVALTKAGVGDDVVLAKIATLPCSYDVSTDGIMALKRSGVASAVIAAMIGRCSNASVSQGFSSADAPPTAKRSAGLYIDLGSVPNYRLERIRPTNASGGRTTGNGSLLFPLKLKLGIPRETAQMVVPAPTKPRFYFYFEPTDARVGDFGSSASASAQSPSEFSLIRLSQKGGQREMVVAKQKLFGANIGIDPKDSIPFTTKEIGDSAFEVETAPLPTGEYGFVLRSGSEAYRIYDFSIQPAGSLPAPW